MTGPVHQNRRQLIRDGMGHPGAGSRPNVWPVHWPALLNQDSMAFGTVAEERSHVSCGNGSKWSGRVRRMVSHCFFEPGIALVDLHGFGHRGHQR